MILKTIFTKRPTSSIVTQVLRYVFSGLTAFVVDFSIMMLLHECFNIDTIIAATFGFCAGLVITYVMSIKWIFDKRKISNSYVEFLIFALIGGIGIVLTYFIMLILSNIVPLHYTLLKIVTSVIITIFNFVAKKLLLFSH